MALELRTVRQPVSRAASRRDHKKFCDIEGWSVVMNSRPKPASHHLTYELQLTDGRILRTRISRPTNSETYGPGLWHHILTEQLDVTETEFWTCVEQRTPPVRVQPGFDPPERALPLSLVRQLVDSLHLSSDDIASLSLDEAIRLMEEFWSGPAE